MCREATCSISRELIKNRLLTPMGKGIHVSHCNDDEKQWQICVDVYRDSIKLCR